MMRPFTCLSLLAALGAGLYLYQEKHNAAVLDRTINATVKQADQVRDHIGMLKLELAQLTDTGRLADLVAHHMPQLQPLMPAQYVRLDDLPARLPAIGSIQAPPPVTDDAPVAAVETPPPPMPAPAPVPEPAVVAAAKPTSVQIAMRPAPKPHAPAARPRPPEYAYSPPRPTYAPVMPAYAPAPVEVHAPTLQTASATAPAPYASAPSYASAPYASAPYASAPFTGSALGMARTTLPPPVPVGALSPR